MDLDVLQLAFMAFDTIKNIFQESAVWLDLQMKMPLLTRILIFPSSILQFVCWQSSKRLIYGSLVCLSCDHFQTLLFATVSDRDPKTLEQGLVQIAFTEESRSKVARFEVGSEVCEQYACR